MLKIYWADADLWKDYDPASLSEYRKQKIGTIQHEQLRRSSVCAELLLLEALRREKALTALPLQIETDENGKPALHDGGYFFNLSHSSHFSACALSDGCVGLDIQVLSPCHESMIKRCFTPEEQDYLLRSYHRDEAFTALWCRKESFLKAIGLGLRMMLSSFSVSGDQTSVEYNGVRYAFFDARIGDLFFCACFPCEGIDKGEAPLMFRLA